MLQQHYEHFYQALLGLSGAHKDYCTKRFSELGLTLGQPKVLSILRTHEGICQKDLAERCHVEPATMTVLLRNMEAASLITKEKITVSGGKRAYAIYLSDHGRILAEKVVLVTQKAERACFDGFSDAEKHHLLLQFQQMEHNLKILCEHEEQL